MGTIKWHTGWKLGLYDLETKQMTDGFDAPLMPASECPGGVSRDSRAFAISHCRPLRQHGRGETSETDSPKEGDWNRTPMCLQLVWTAEYQ
jgi:hypothetical protein